MTRMWFPLISFLSLLLGTSAIAQTDDIAPYRDEEGNWIPWYAPNPDGETRATVDLRFAPTETKMIGPSPSASGATKYGDYGVSYSQRLEGNMLSGLRKGLNASSSYVGGKYYDSKAFITNTILWKTKSTREKK